MPIVQLTNVFLILFFAVTLISSPLSYSGLENNVNLDSNSTLNPIGIVFAQESEEETEAETEEETEEETETESEEEYEGVSEDEVIITNLGQEVSDFVREARAQFSEQKEETKSVIKECRENMKNADPLDRKEVRKQCKDNLKDIRDSYKDLRRVYQETFKEFRDNIKVLIREAKGLPVDETEKNTALTEIESISSDIDTQEKISELRKSMKEETKEERKQLREQHKEEREQLREERQAAKEQMKEERESAKEQMKEERESAKEQKKEDKNNP